MVKPKKDQNVKTEIESTSKPAPKAASASPAKAEKLPKKKNQANDNTPEKNIEKPKNIKPAPIKNEDKKVNIEKKKEPIQNKGANNPIQKRFVKGEKTPNKNTPHSTDESEEDGKPSNPSKTLKTQKRPKLEEKIETSEESSDNDEQNDDSTEPQVPKRKRVRPRRRRNKGNAIAKADSKEEDSASEAAEKSSTEKPKKERKPRRLNRPPKNAVSVFIGGLSAETTQNSLQTFMSTTNPLFVKLAWDQHRHESRRFGFASFETKEEAEAAIKKIHGTTLDGSTVRAQLDTKHGQLGKQNHDGKDGEKDAMNENASQKTLCVLGLPEKINTEAELLALFSEYGAHAARMPISRETQQTRGFGYVHFNTAENAEAALKAMNEKEIDGKKLRVRAFRHHQHSFNRRRQADKQKSEN